MPMPATSPHSATAPEPTAQAGPETPTTGDADQATGCEDSEDSEDSGTAQKAAKPANTVSLSHTLTRKPDRPLGWRALVRLWRGVREAGYASRLYRYRLTGKHPLKLLGSPDDPWPGSPARGQDVLDGRWRLGRLDMALDDRRPWAALKTAPAPLARWVHSFEWLRDLAHLPDQRAARERAQALTQAWLDGFGDWHRTAWAPEVLGARLIQWMTHAPLVLTTNDMVYRSAVLNATARQARHLARTAGDAPDGVARVTALVGLVLSGLLLPGGEARMVRGLKLLDRTLLRLIPPDGGIATRNPADAVAVMRHLILLKAAFKDRAVEPPSWLQNTLDRQGPFIRGLMHADGGLAQFNGAFADDDSLIEAVLTASDARGRPLENAAHTGFQRLKRRRTLVLVDTGPAPQRSLGPTGHAGTLAMEMSDGRDRIVVNMGGSVLDRGGALDPLNRTTAAHSTLVVADTNSTQLLGKGGPSRYGFGKAALGEGPNRVHVARHESAPGVGLTARHDGYVRRFGLTHERALYLDKDGTVLAGEDRLSGRDQKRPLKIDVRFHLHPDIAASPTQDGQGVILRTPTGHGWLFRADGWDVTLEDSVYSSRPDRPARAQQIVATGAARGGRAALSWSFKRLDTGT